MGIKDRMRQLERAAEGEVESFELQDGSRYYFESASWELFGHWMECGRAGNARNWSEPPETVRKLTEAKDVAQAIEKVRGGGGWNCLVYDEEVLITERRLEPRPLVSRYDPKVGKRVPIDPYEYNGPEDLSE